MSTQESSAPLTSPEGQAAIADQVDAVNSDTGEEIEGQEALPEGEEAEAKSEADIKKETKELKDLKKKLKLKVNGKEVEEELDFNDDEGLTKRLQKARAFDEKAQELAQLRKEVSDLVKMLKESPEAVMAELGIDPLEWSYNQLQRKVEEEKKSPEQKERERLEAEYKREKQLREQLEQERKSIEEERRRDTQAAQIQDSIISTLQNHNGYLDVSDPVAVGEIARAMSEALSLAMQDPETYGHLADVTPEQVIPLVEEREQARIQRRVEKLAAKGDIKAIEKMFGKKNLDLIRKARVQAAAPKVQKPVVKDSGQSSRDMEKAEESKKVRARDFFKNLG